MKKRKQRTQEKKKQLKKIQQKKNGLRTESQEKNMQKTYTIAKKFIISEIPMLDLITFHLQQAYVLHYFDDWRTAIKTTSLYPRLSLLQPTGAWHHSSLPK